MKFCQRLEYFRYLNFYPGGYNVQKYKNSISLFLSLKGADSKSFNTSFILGITGKNGNEEVKCEWPGESFSTGHGTTNLLTRADFLNPELGYLVDGKVTLYCKVSDLISKSKYFNLSSQLFSAHDHCQESSRRRQESFVEPKSTW